MTTKVGINGFGRIGRQVFKAIRDYYPDSLEVVAVNDIGDVATMAHLLKYDSNYGKFDGKVEVVEGGLKVDGKLLKVLAHQTLKLMLKLWLNTLYKKRLIKLMKKLLS